MRLFIQDLIRCYVSLMGVQWCNFNAGSFTTLQLRHWIITTASNACRVLWMPSTLKTWSGKLSELGNIWKHCVSHPKLHPSSFSLEPQKMGHWKGRFLGLSPLPVRVTTRIITFLVGNPYKPSFPLLLGGGTTQEIPLGNPSFSGSMLNFGGVPFTQVDLPFETHEMSDELEGKSMAFKGGFFWAVLSDEQMSNGWPYSLLNDEQMSNKVRVEHQPVLVTCQLGMKR